MVRDLPADVRALIVRELGAALAMAWRRQHVNDYRDQQRDPREVVSRQVVEIRSPRS